MVYYVSNAVKITLKVVELADAGNPKSLKLPELISTENVAIPTGWLIVPNYDRYALVLSWTTLIVVLLKLLPSTAWIW